MKIKIFQGSQSQVELDVNNFLDVNNIVLQDIKVNIIKIMGIIDVVTHATVIYRDLDS